MPSTPPFAPAIRSLRISDHDRSWKMSNSIRSWLVSAIEQHHKTYGSDLEKEEQGHFVQILAFHTHRTETQPHEQIVATVADRTHRFRIRFDVAATDEYESKEGSLGVLSEPLTSHIRTIIRIQTYNFSLLPPKTRQKYDAPIPEVILDVKSWEVRSGDRTETVYWPDAREINENDERASRILMKWWSGSDDSPGMTDQVTKEWKARRAAKSATPEQSLHTPVISQTKTSLYNNYTEGKKYVPAVLWTIPADQQKELDMIKCFGLDPVKMAAQEEGEASAEGEEDDLESQAGELIEETNVPWSPSPTPQSRDVEQPDIPSEASPTPPSPPPPPTRLSGSSSDSHQAAAASSFKLPVSFQVEHNDSDSEEELNVRPLISRKSARKSDGAVDSMSSKSLEHSTRPLQPELSASLEVDGEELPGSLTSESRFDLAAASARRASRPRVLVADSDKEQLKADTSMESTNQSQNPSQGFLPSELQPVAVTQSKRKRESSPAEKEEAELSMEADDEDSLPVPTQSTTPRGTPGLRGALSYINPMNLFSSSKGQTPDSSRTNAQTLGSQSPSMLSRFMPGRNSREDESRSGSSVGDEEDEEKAPNQMASSNVVEAPMLQQPKRFKQAVPSETPNKGSRSSVSSALSAAPEVTTSAARERAQISNRTKGRSRMNGFELNLIPSDGLAEDKVQEMLEEARRARVAIQN